MFFLLVFEFICYVGFIGFLVLFSCLCLFQSIGQSIGWFGAFLRSFFWLLKFCNIIIMNVIGNYATTLIGRVFNAIA